MLVLLAPVSACPRPCKDPIVHRTPWHTAHHEESTKALENVAVQKKTPRQINMTRMLRLLVLITAPMLVMQMVVLCYSHPCLDQTANVDVVEYYAGECEVSKSFWREKMISYPMDIVLNEDTMNILDEKGTV